MTRHWYTGVQGGAIVDPDGWVLAVLYRGMCRCGYRGQWESDRDRAWFAITDHFVTEIRKARDQMMSTARRSLAPTQVTQAKVLTETEAT